MNRFRPTELVPIVAALVDGRPVQFAWSDQEQQDADNWLAVDCNHVINCEKFKYRLKPTPRIFYVIITPENNLVAKYGGMEAARAPAGEVIKVVEVL